MDKIITEFRCELLSNHYLCANKNSEEMDWNLKNEL